MERTALASAERVSTGAVAASPEPPAYRVYSLWQIFAAACACFVAGPILLAQSFMRVGDMRRARIALLLGVPFFIANLALILYRPNGAVGGWIIPIGIFIGVTRKPYGTVYRAHLAAGGKREPWWKAVLIAALALGIVDVVLALANRFVGTPMPFENR